MQFNNKQQKNKRFCRKIFNRNKKTAQNFRKLDNVTAKINNRD